MSLLSVAGLSFRYPSTIELFRDVSFAINTADHVAVVGPNGSGKSTLLRLLAAGLEPSTGAIVRRRGLRIEHLLQEPEPDVAGTLFDFVFAAHKDLAALRSRLLTDPSDAAEFADAGGYAAEAQTGRILDGLGFTADDRDLPFRLLSGGQRTRAALARALHSDADLLLLDEPTNYLDVAAREWLEVWLTEGRAACVVVSHDRTLLRRVAARVIEIERGRASVFEGGYDDYRSWRALRERQAWAQYDAQQRRIAAAEQAARRRSQLALQVAAAPEGMRQNRDFYGRKASKVARTARLLRERADHETQAAKPWEEEPIPILDFVNVRRSGDVALTLSGVAKAYGSRRLFSGLTLHIARGDRLAIAGPNGAGKTTLLRIIAGAEQADAGEVRSGANVVAGYLRQEAGGLDPDSSALDLCGAGTLPRTLLGCLKLRPDRVNRPQRELSPGERSKVALVRLLVSGANLLLLDEPTNHLEIEAQEALEQTLAQFPGTIVVVSHDRSFLAGLGPSLRTVSLTESPS